MGGDSQTESEFASPWPLRLFALLIGIAVFVTAILFRLPLAEMPTPQTEVSSEEAPDLSAFLAPATDSTPRPRSSLIQSIDDIYQYQLGDGLLTLALHVAGAGDDAPAIRSISDDANAIELRAHAASQSLALNLLAELVPEEATDRRLSAQPFALSAPSGSASVALTPSALGTGYFAAGAYRVNVWQDSRVIARLPLEVQSAHPVAAAVDVLAPMPYANIAQRQLGGHVVAVSSEYPGAQWASKNVVDGFARVRDARGNVSSGGWRSADGDTQPSITIGYGSDRATDIVAIELDIVDEDEDGPDKPSIRPRTVEVLSHAAPGAEPLEVAVVRLPNVSGRYRLPLGTFKAAEVTFRFPARYGERSVAVGEIRIYEDDAVAASVIADRAVNVAALENGGAIVAVSSETRDNPAHQLLDGIVGAENGWHSERASGDTDTEPTPQSVVIGFRHRLPVLIDRIILHPESSPRYGAGNFSGNWPAELQVAVRHDTATFEEVALVSMPQSTEPQEVMIGREAREVRITVLANRGGNRVSLGEVEVLEGRNTDYRSVLARGPADRETLRSIDAGSSQRQATHEEESNDEPTSAMSLQSNDTVRGVNAGGRDPDYYRVSVAGREPQVLTATLAAEPRVYSSLHLFDADGRTLDAIRPAGLPEVTRSWLLEPGDYLLRVSEQPLRTVLVWDDSGSMGGRTAELRRGIRTYIEQLPADEQVALLRFSDQSTLIGGGFTDDSDTLLSELDGGFNASGGTAMYDAIERAFDMLASHYGRKAIVLFTDGQDFNSQQSLNTLRARLTQSGVPLYAIGLGSTLRDLSMSSGYSGDSLLAGLAESTGGDAFHAETADEIAGHYAAIAAALRTRLPYYLTASVSAGTGEVEVVLDNDAVEAAIPPRVVFVLDASGSMRRQLDGRSMMDVAKATVQTAIESLPANVEVGLRVFGDRIREGDSGDCEDTRTLLPMARHSAAEVDAALSDVRALGTTLISHSLRAVAESLPTGYAAQTTIVLVTDGEEECSENPAETVAEFRSSGLNVVLNVVGFDLDDEAVVADMRALAAAGTGAYFDAGDGAGLSTAVRQALAGHFRVLDGAGQPVAEGRVAVGAVSAPAGRYTLHLDTGRGWLEVKDVTVSPEDTTTVRLRQSGRQVVALSASGGEYPVRVVEFDPPDDDDE